MIASTLRFLPVQAQPPVHLVQDGALRDGHYEFSLRSDEAQAELAKRIYGVPVDGGQSHTVKRFNPKMDWQRGKVSSGGDAYGYFQYGWSIDPDKEAFWTLEAVKKAMKVKDHPTVVVPVDALFSRAVFEKTLHWGYRFRSIAALADQQGLGAATLIVSGFSTSELFDDVALQRLPKLTSALVNSDVYRDFVRQRHNFKTWIVKSFYERGLNATLADLDQRFPHLKSEIRELILHTLFDDSFGWQNFGHYPGSHTCIVAPHSAIKAWLHSTDYYAFQRDVRGEREAYVGFYPEYEFAEDGQLLDYSALHELNFAKMDENSNSFEDFLKRVTELLAIKPDN